MSDSSRYLVPKDIEQSVPIFGAHPVDLSFSVMMFSFGIVAHSLFISLSLTIGFLIILSKLRKGVKRGYSQHYLWRIGMTSFDNFLDKYYPHPSENDFIK